MTTIILTTSCAPIKSNLASNLSGNKAEWLNFGNDQFSGATHSKNACASNVDGYAGVDVDQDSADTPSSSKNYQRGHDNSCLPHTSSPSKHSSHNHDYTGNTRLGLLSRDNNNNAREIIDKLQTLPLQCDITIIPRAHPITDELSVTATPLDSEGITSDNNVHDEVIHNIIQPIRISRQQFHPCGTENIVRLAKGAAVSTEFILSLANCGVHVHIDGSSTMLPIQAIPSSVSIPTNNEDDDELGLLFIRDMSSLYSYSEGGETRNVEEIAVSFDFSTAVDNYQQKLEDSKQKAAVMERESSHDDDTPQVHIQSRNEDHNDVAGKMTDSIIANNSKNMEIKSIMSTLEQESLFIKKTLLVLGSFACILLICMVWTIWKLVGRGRRARRRVGGSCTTITKGQVKKVFVEVPREIIDSKSRGATLRSNPSNGRAPFLEEISPIRSPVVSLDGGAKESEMANELEVESNTKKEMHETLYLITPTDETGGGDGSNDDGQKQSLSPRNWYEDFLSPRGCPKKPQRNKSDVALSSSETKEVARSLFCSSQDSVKESPSLENKDSFEDSKSCSKSSVLMNTRKKKVLVTPIERTPLSPPPSDVSLLKLSQDIEWSKSPLIRSTVTEETQESSTRDEQLDEELNDTFSNDDIEEHPSSIEIVEKLETCSISPIPIKELSNAIHPVEVNTPMPKCSGTMKTSAADITIGSQESLFSTSQKARRIFAEELAKKAGLAPTSVVKKDFKTRIAIRAAEVQTPKKSLTPRSASSSLCDDDEPSPFLADYWEHTA